ncbi:unnamed protein product [Closterium sp. Naga37s-1]|nr:unnamed protein product [Closterium sp. Naga37s-1]
MKIGAVEGPAIGVDVAATVTVISAAAADVVSVVADVVSAAADVVSPAADVVSAAVECVFPGWLALGNGCVLMQESDSLAMQLTMFLVPCAG